MLPVDPSSVCRALLLFFFFNDTATTEIYTLSLHDALPISKRYDSASVRSPWRQARGRARGSSSAAACGLIRSSRVKERDRKSTRLNSSHANISYAVFCLKKKKKTSSMLRITYVLYNL